MYEKAIKSEPDIKYDPNTRTVKIRYEGKYRTYSDIQRIMLELPNYLIRQLY